MTTYHIKGACHTNTSFLSLESRIKFEGVEEAPSSKPGICCHSWIVAFLLRLFSDKKVVDIKDINGRIYHLNRGSLSNWLRKNYDHVKESTKEDMLNVTESAMRSWLEEVLAKKSPHYIVRISDIKNELIVKERFKKNADQIKGNISIAEQNLPQEILLLKNQLREANEERSKTNNL